MRRRFLVLGGAAATAALSLAACSGGSGDQRGSDVPATAVDAREAAAKPVAWSTFGFDLANSRFNKAERTITPANVATLAKVWEVSGLKGVASTPSVVDGVVYFGAWDGKVHAVDAATGEERWATEMPKVVVPGVMSSVTISGDAVFAALSGIVVKLAKADGTLQWTAKVSEHPIAIEPGSPIVIGDLVIEGAASGELMVPVDDYRFRGVLRAFDVETGEQRWEVFFTPDTPEEGGAGVGIWSTPSIDPTRKLLFIGTGNTYEPPAAELSDSLVAIRYETGEVAWSRQFTYPDVWSTGNTGGVDGDVGAGPNLWEVDGRALVGAGDKRGVYHALDRDTGEVVWETQLTPGSLLGGVIGTSAYGEGRLYVGSNVGDPASNGPTGKTKLLAVDARDGKILWGSEFDGAIYSPVRTTPGLVYVGSTTGSMFVFDAVTGARLWTYDAPDQVGGGATVVDGTVYWGYGFSLFGSGAGQGGVIAFRPTGGPSTTVPAGSGESAQPSPRAPGADTFRKSCASCHGIRGLGVNGPDLTQVEERLTFDQHAAIVTDGKGTQMPAFGKTLTPDEIRQVVEYERTAL